MRRAKDLFPGGFAEEEVHGSRAEDLAGREHAGFESKGALVRLSLGALGSRRRSCSPRLSSQGDYFQSKQVKGNIDGGQTTIRVTKHGCSKRTFRWSRVRNRRRSNLPRGPWKRTGGNGAYIELKGMEGFTGMYVGEIPPGGALNAENHLYEELIYILQRRRRHRTLAAGR